MPSTAVLTYPMNVSAEPIVFPVGHHHQFHHGNHTPMFTSASPVATNNKIREINKKKSRITLQSYYDFTDIRPINLTNIGGTTNTPISIANISPEKLIERSKELRLSRISAYHNSNQNALSSLSTANQTSLLWPNYHTTMSKVKQSQMNSPTLSSSALGTTTNKLPTIHMPEIQQQRASRTQTLTRLPTNERQNNSYIQVELRHKSLTKPKSTMPKAYDQKLLKVKSSFSTQHAQLLKASHRNYSKQPKKDTQGKILHLYESEEEDSDPIIDVEMEEYIRKATVKCADWLIKYVFDQEHDSIDDA